MWAWRNVIGDGLSKSKRGRKRDKGRQREGSEGEERERPERKEREKQKAVEDRWLNLFCSFLWGLNNTAVCVTVCASSCPPLVSCPAGNMTIQQFHRSHPRCVCVVIYDFCPESGSLVKNTTIVSSVPQDTNTVWKVTVLRSGAAQCFCGLQTHLLVEKCPSAVDWSLVSLDSVSGV